jgi:hypothetical protein
VWGAAYTQRDAAQHRLVGFDALVGRDDHTLRTALRYQPFLF